MFAIRIGNYRKLYLLVRRIIMVACLDGQVCHVRQDVESLSQDHEVAKQIFRFSVQRIFGSDGALAHLVLVAGTLTRVLDQ